MLRNWIIGLLTALFMAFAVTGCANLSRATSNAELGVYDERALISAELGFSFITDTIETADSVGLLTPERAQRLLPAYRETYRALRAARLAYDANRAAEGAVETRNAIAAVASLVALLQELELIRRVPAEQSV